MTTERKVKDGTYKSAWCGQEPRQHGRCGISKCTCTCHSINAIVKEAK